MNSVCISNISGHVVTATKHKGVGSMKDVLIQIKGKRKKNPFNSLQVSTAFTTLSFFFFSFTFAKGGKN